MKDGPATPDDRREPVNRDRPGGDLDPNRDLIVPSFAERLRLSGMPNPSALRYPSAGDFREFGMPVRGEAEPLRIGIPPNTANGDGLANRLENESRPHLRIGASRDWDGIDRRQSGITPGHRLPSISGYEILAELGRGGMGVVYKARQHRLNRMVALKMILAGDYAGLDAVQRFMAEAEIVARLQHPNIVQIYAIGDFEGRPYVELEYVEGGSLASRIDGTPSAPSDAAQLVESLAWGMA